MRQNKRVAAKVLKEVPGLYCKIGNWLWLNEAKFDELKAEGYVEEYTPESMIELPEDLPGRAAFIKEGIITLEQVQGAGPGWSSINGIGTETQNDLTEYFGNN